MRARQRNQAGSVRQGALNNFRSNLADSFCLKQDRLDAVSLQAEPRVNVSRIIVQVTHHFVPGFPIETIGNGIQTT